jgi:hypothetical protein
VDPLECLRTGEWPSDLECHHTRTAPVRQLSESRRRHPFRRGADPRCRSDYWHSRASRTAVRGTAESTKKTSGRFDARTANISITLVVGRVDRAGRGCAGSNRPAHRWTGVWRWPFGMAGSRHCHVQHRRPAIRDVSVIYPETSFLLWRSRPLSLTWGGLAGFTAYRIGFDSQFDECSEHGARFSVLRKRSARDSWMWEIFSRHARRCGQAKRALTKFSRCGTRCRPGISAHTRTPGALRSRLAGDSW